MITSNYFNNIALARDMMTSGYINTIVSAESGLQQKFLREMRREMEDSGLLEKNRDRLLRSCKSIIKRAQDREDAAILMLAYRRLGGAAWVLRSVNIAALNEAYGTYTLIKHEIERSPSSLMTINDAYVLAKELRLGYALYETCHECHADWYYSERQKAHITCPFCTKTKTSNSNSEKLRTVDTRFFTNSL